MVCLLLLVWRGVDALEGDAEAKREERLAVFVGLAAPDIA